jgi:peptidoglycan/LPS O-acetylase OafA/YrhL
VPFVAAATLPRLGYRPALDGIRAVAIALVVCWHAFGRPSGGFLGVHVFFALSGFLITTLLLEEWASRGSISLARFYQRRALRLFPALAAMLGVYTVVQLVRAYVLDSPNLDVGTSMKGVLWSALYVSNIVQAHGTVLGVPISHLWSLAAEEQFYVVWPCVLLLALRAGAGRRALAVGLAALVALLWLHRFHLAQTDASQRRLYFAPDTNFDAILIGCLAGLGFRAGCPRRLLTAAAAAALLAVAAIVAAVDLGDRALYGELLGVFAVSAAVLVLAAATGAPSLLSRSLSLPPLVFLGQISYSLYLWHPMILSFGDKLLGIPRAFGVVISLAVATASYYLVERPFLRLKRRRGAPEEPGATGFAPAPPGAA